jgi:hypothetical protein
MVVAVTVELITTVPQLQQTLAVVVAVQVTT